MEKIRTYQGELAAFRQDLHAHPELGMEEFRTSQKVADKLAEWGIAVHRGVGGTGVVGVLRAGDGPASVGLRADMDALAMQETGNRPYSSGTAGRMHACGHDGHTTMLLGAAKYLAETRDFDGTVNFIFQPAEEGRGGAEAMLEDGLLTRFPCDRIFGMHNWPGYPVGSFAINSGPVMAGGGFFDIVVTGRGAHGARPEESVDPVLTACHIVTALQSIVARNVAPRDTAVLSVTKIVGGDAHNVIPQVARIGGTLRAFDPALLARIKERMATVASGVAMAFGATAELSFGVRFAPTVNDEECAREFADAAQDIGGEITVDRAMAPVMGSEDFSFMLEAVRGAYICIGNGDSAPLHHPDYDFNDEAIAYGASALARVVERVMQPPG
nr:M20 aminoacylase family protein [Gluconacetobacter tumulisoli]